MRFHPFKQTVPEDKPLIPNYDERERFIFLQYRQAAIRQIQSADEFVDRKNRRILIGDNAVHTDTYLSGSDVSWESDSWLCLESSSRNAMLSLIVFPSSRYATYPSCSTH